MLRCMAVLKSAMSFSTRLYQILRRSASEVASEIPADVVGEVKVLWRLGDSPHIVI